MYTCARTVYVWAKAVVSFGLGLPAAAVCCAKRSAARLTQVCAQPPTFCI